MAEMTLESAFASVLDELARLLPAGSEVLDAHTHLGDDEDGSSLRPDGLLAHLDVVSPTARAVTFPLHDPDRNPGYRRPNDRVLDWARDSGGRIIPYCRLDPSDDPVAEAERCLARGARGIKLHPRAQAFLFDRPEMDAIFDVARDAGVPILVHAGRGMAPMDSLADIALRHPEVPLVLAHGAIAGQGMFAERLAGHPAVLYDTSCFSTIDVVELFARVPAERIVFASDVPYGRPANGLFQALRVAALAGLDEDDRRLLAGGTMARVLDREPLAPLRPPRLDGVRPASGPLQRIGSYLMMAFGAVMASAGGPRRFDPALAAPAIAMARCVPRDPDPGPAAAALERIDAMLAHAEHFIAQPADGTPAALGLVHASIVVAATEPAEA
jgi:hypothetical protein